MKFLALVVSPILAVPLLAAAGIFSLSVGDSGLQNGQILTHPASAPPISTGYFGYVCPDGRGFRYSLQGQFQQGMVIVDETNKLAFNLRKLPFSNGTVYGDGTILLFRLADGGDVLVDGEPYFANCALRTWDYRCVGTGAFTLDVLGKDQEQAIFTDDTNRKKFTLDRQATSDGMRFSDGVIDVRIDWTVASVTVGGNLYFRKCDLQ
jgi:hypothetical protein